jgi:hypothetical protein
MIGPEHETPRPSSGAGFAEAVTFTFGDAEQRLYGSARLGLVPGDPTLASGLGLLFDAEQAIAAEATGGIELNDPDWSTLQAGDVSTATVEPLRVWTTSYDGDEGGFELRFEALGPPAEIGSGTIAQSAADLHGYEQVCRVTGTVRHGERRREVDCLGQRGHQWGAPDWSRIALARTVAIWCDDGDSVALAAVRPDGAEGHEGELVSAALLGRGEAGPIADVRLSTTFDADGRQRRAGLELWVADEDPMPRRAAGEAVCGTTLDLGRLRFDCAFFHWRMEGRQGVGRYDVLHRA